MSISNTAFLQWKDAVSCHDIPVHQYTFANLQTVKPILFRHRHCDIIHLIESRGTNGLLGMDLIQFLQYCCPIFLQESNYFQSHYLLTDLHYSCLLTFEREQIDEIQAYEYSHQHEILYRLLSKCAYNPHSYIQRYHLSQIRYMDPQDELSNHRQTRSTKVISPVANSFHHHS